MQQTPGQKLPGGAYRDCQKQAALQREHPGAVVRSPKISDISVSMII